MIKIKHNAKKLKVRLQGPAVKPLSQTNISVIRRVAELLFHMVECENTPIIYRLEFEIYTDDVEKEFEKRICELKLEKMAKEKSMKKVDSSNVDSIHYEPSTRKLTVVFKNGGTYEYHDVSPEKYQELENAESIGGHLHKHIKSAHQYTKVSG